MRESAVRGSPLPPSVEKAYHQKCIDLKRRLREVEESNDSARQRLHRLNRAIMKMRVNRAFLMDRLSKMQELKDYESDQSSTRPPTPDDLPSRPKRNYRRRSSPPADRNNAAPSPPPGAPGAFGPPHSHHYPPQHMAVQHPAPPAQHAPHVQPMPHPQQHVDLRSTPHQPPFAPAPHEPLIHSLPNGTSVMLVAPGIPKPSPWHISELDPRHHVKPEFDNWTLDEQEDCIFDGYLPFDIQGNPVLVEYDPMVRKYVHIFPGNPGWRNPVVDSVRRDSKESRQRLPRPPPGPEKEDAHMSSDAQRTEGETRGQAAAGGFTAANR